MPIGPARMPLMDHLGELRMRLVRIVVVMIIAICVFYLATPTIIEFLFLPINDLVSSVIALDPFEAFSVRLSVSLWTSLIACSPIIIWQILAFFLPALKPSERKWFLPTFVAGLFKAQNALVHNLIEGVIKIFIFIMYLFLCSKQKDVHRVFQYHGAEHKTIFCYEAGLPLTVENARIQPRHHPRCGTSFLFVVIVVSILFSSVAFTYVEWQNLWVRIGMHLLLLVPVVGLTYEFNRFVGRHDNAVTRVLSAPGMWLQNFTTFEPDDSMLEVAIQALELVLPEEKGKDAW